MELYININVLTKYREYGIIHFSYYILQKKKCFKIVKKKLSKNRSLWRIK